jgi:hypothetical protein
MIFLNQYLGYRFGLLMFFIALVMTPLIFFQRFRVSNRRSVQEQFIAYATGAAWGFLGAEFILTTFFGFPKASIPIIPDR